ncbi:hypothetical protein EGW08_012955, partial [Elysia chlorotica]
AGSVDEHPRVDILQQATLDAEIDPADGIASCEEFSTVLVAQRDESDETKTFGPKPLSGEVTVTRVEDASNPSSVTVVVVEPAIAKTTTSTTASISSVQLSSNADISMSDFDISLTGVPVSNMGPDAGDKFLDLVLQNSEQGFSGLLSTPKKSSSCVSSLPLFTTYSSPVLSTTQESRVLRTPTHFGSAAPVGLITPIKLDLDQEWGGSLAVGDISLSNILDDASSFRAGSEQKYPNVSLPVQLDMSSNDGFMKDGNVADLSFSSLLGDPSFKKEDDSTCGLSPPLSSASQVAPLPSPVSVSGASHAAGGDERERPGEEGRLRGGEEERGSAQLFSEVSRDSFTTKLDVDGSLRGIMASETSLDLVGKFEALAGAAGSAVSRGSGGVQAAGISDSLGEDVTLGMALSQLMVKCREEAVDSHTVKLQSPSAS